MSVAMPPSRPSFHVMTKPAGYRCNLDCDYCYYLEKESLYPAGEKIAMSDALLEQFVSQYIDSQSTETVTFAWQGGEPTLLGLDFFDRVVELQRRYANGRTIENALQTNGVLVDDAWCRFFKEHNFLIGISVDGPEARHNCYRLNKGRQGSFEQVMRGLEALKRHRVEFNTLTAVQRDNVEYPLEVYEFLKQIGSRFMQFIPIVERWPGSGEERQGKTPGRESLGDLSHILHEPSPNDIAPVTDWSVPAERYGVFLNAVFDQWVRQDVGRYFVQIFDVVLSVWIGAPPGLCVFQETCGAALAIEHNGDLYSCDHYVYPNYRLGNLTETPLGEMALSDSQLAFGRAKMETLPTYCRSCEVRFLCNGECPKHRFAMTPDGKEGLNYLCPSYRKFFAYTAPYMRFMAQELSLNRPAALVMAWVKEKDRGFPTLKVGRNNLCPCGSGRKYKQCCGG